MKRDSLFLLTAHFFYKKLRSRVAPVKVSLKLHHLNTESILRVSEFLIVYLVELCSPNVLITFIIENIFFTIASEPDIRELIL